MPKIKYNNNYKRVTERKGCHFYENWHMDSFRNVSSQN